MINLSEKQKFTLTDSDARLNVWEGAVRSGKSYASILRWLNFIQNAPEGELVAIGKTQDTIKLNIVNPILSLVGGDAKHYSGKREMRLWGRTIHLVGASDERAENKIRGPTFSGAYVDEITLLPESFFVMLLSRLSRSGSKLFGTTNPDTPFHWFKKNYLDRKETLNLKHWQFNLEDNPSLTDEFKEDLKREYQGLWYRRYINGEWCLAEGAIYDFFDENLHTINFTTNTATYYLAGVDYGTTNPTAFVLIGFNPTVYPNIWVEKEYYYDSLKHARQQTDSEFAQDLKKFIEGYIVKNIYIDPAAESFKVECRRQQINNLMDAKNDVLDGIRFVSSLLTNGTLKITRNCKNLLQEFQSYSWDSKSRHLGIDKPLKTNDHCFAKGTKISTLNGNISIEKITKKDKVLTPIGYKTVNEVFIHDDDVYEYIILGKKIKCTKNHKFFTLNGWKESSKLIQSDIFFINISKNKCLQKSSFLMESNTDGIYPPKIYPIENISERINQIVLKDTAICIEMFGNSIMENYQKDIIYITSTEIPKTMTLATSSLFHLLNTYPIIKKILVINKKKIKDYIAKKLDLSQKNGITQKMVKNGIKNISKIPLEKLNPSNISVNNVKQNITLKSNKDQNFVRINVNQNGEEIISLMMSLDFVNSVIMNLKETNIVKQNIAINPVPSKHIGKEKVYNLNIQDINVYFAENILSLNCLDSLRYALFTHFGSNIGEENRMSLEMLKQLKRKHLGEF